MTDKQIINSCEFQSRCIQYKDMYSNKHIKCPIVEFALACRGENKCKYKTVYEQLKAKEQECERLKNELSTYGATGICETCTEKSVLKCDQLEEENRSLKSELMQNNCYLDADKEIIDQLKTENENLRKQLRFEFDETLLQYSNTIEDLQKQLNNTVMQKCPQCGEIYLNPVGCELYEENQQLKAENKTQKETINGFLTILGMLGRNNIKLRETLAEIKEIIEQGVKIHDDIIVSKKVLQIIDEVEND